MAVAALLEELKRSVRAEQEADSGSCGHSVSRPSLRLRDAYWSISRRGECLVFVGGAVEALQLFFFISLIVAAYRRGSHRQC